VNVNCSVKLQKSASETLEILKTVYGESLGQRSYGCQFFFNPHRGVESKLGPLGTSTTNWPIVPGPGDCEDGEFGRMKIVKGNRNTLRKAAPAPLRPPQIPLDQTRARTRAAAVGSQRLTA
jgi:hypothetical protein